MRIGFTGSHGCGKTDVAIKLAEGLQLEFIPSASRRLYEEGFKINEEADELSQLLILTKRIIDEQAVNDRYIVDRTPLDSLAYTCWQFINVWKDTKETYYSVCEELTYQHMVNRGYDHLFYFPISFPLQADGVRPEKEEYRQGIDDTIKNYLNLWGIDYYIIPEGTVEERVNFVVQKVVK